MDSVTGTGNAHCPQVCAMHGIPLTVMGVAKAKWFPAEAGSRKIYCTGPVPWKEYSRDRGRAEVGVQKCEVVRRILKG